MKWLLSKNLFFATNYLIPCVLIFLVLLNSGCTINRRYHFGGFSIRQVSENRNYEKQPMVDRGQGNLSKEKKLADLNGIKQSESFLIYNLKLSSVQEILDKSKCEEKSEVLEFDWYKLVGNEHSKELLTANYFPTVTKTFQKEAKSPEQVSYVDTADPEFWANIFLILGLVVGAAALVFPIKVLGAIALLLLLIGVGCAALCEGDFYYSSTKILAIISAIILFLWGGVNADIFDL